jgi:amino acid adenylation domain-containing protein
VSNYKTNTCIPVHPCKIFRAYCTSKLLQAVFYFDRERVTLTRIEQMVFQQAAHTPDNLAIKHGSTEFRYAELVKRAIETGVALWQLEVRPNQRVGLYLPKSAEAIALVLGIWHIGAVVVPLNPAAPAELLETIISDADLQLIVTSAKLATRLTSTHHNAPTVINLEELTLPGSTVNASKPENDDCYIFYTSGSQGQPKGVVGLHSSLEHYLKWQAAEFKVSPDERFSQFAPLSFDFSLKEILVPLICGASVHLAETETVADPEGLLQWISANNITTMCCVPTVFRALTRVLAESPQAVASLQSLNHLLISGDILRWEDVSRWREVVGHRLPLTNLYGPTESTVIKFFYPIPDLPISDTTSVPVGKAIPETELLILDEAGQSCPSGEIGQVVILSKWLAKGYHRHQVGERPAFTRLLQQGEWVRAYQTGDLGRVLPDGNLELCGRQDRQVKIHGHRLELDAIEAILAKHSAVKDVAIITTGVDDDLSLFCFYQADASLPETVLREFARERMLPQAVPTRFRRLEVMPLSVNGKVNRQILNELAKKEQAVEGVAPVSDIQGIVLESWQQCLELSEIDPEANFFEIGGDSINAIKILYQLRSRIHPKITLNDLFLHPTVAQFSEWVSNQPELNNSIRED